MANPMKLQEKGKAEVAEVRAARGVTATTVPRRCTITIEDLRDGETAKINLYFDPPYRSGEELSPSVTLAMRMLESIKSDSPALAEAFK